MNEIIKIAKHEVAIKTCYDPSHTPTFNKDTKPNPKAIEVAKETLSPVAFDLYKTICSLPNRAFVVRLIEVLANKLHISIEDCNAAIDEIVTNKYLNYTEVRYKDDTYVGETFMFIPDNSLVAVVPSGYVAKTDEEYARLVEAWKKPYFFTGKHNIEKKVY